jgi:hypothetical protein
MASAAKLKFPPGPSIGLRRWSLGPLNSGDPLNYFTGIMREYGDVVGLRVLNFRILLINHPDYIEDVLVNHPRKFKKGAYCKPTNAFLEEACSRVRVISGCGKGGWRSRRFTAGGSLAMPRRWWNIPSGCCMNGKTAKSATSTKK